MTEIGVERFKQNEDRSYAKEKKPGQKNQFFVFQIGKIYCFSRSIGCHSYLKRQS